jgi:hypothetical protein
MQTLNTENKSLDTTREILDLEPSRILDTQVNRPKLYMKWEKEFDGKHYRLVARWLLQD